MSHFSVLVVTPMKPTKRSLSAALRPWHEFECTGIDDDHVIDIDETEKLRNDYEKDEITRLRLPDGSLADPWSDEFLRDPTEKEREIIGPIGGTGAGGGISWTSHDPGDGGGYRRFVRFVPDGAERIKLPAKELMTFLEWLVDREGRRVVERGSTPDLIEEHKYGYVLLDADGNVKKIIKRTNPNGKWDYWTLGGRFSGRLVPGYDARKDPENKEKCRSCDGRGKENAKKTCKRCDGTGLELKWPSDWRNVGNCSKVADFDIDAAQIANELARGRSWDEFERRYDEAPVHGLGFSEALRAFDAALREFKADPGPTGVSGRMEADAKVSALRSALSFALFDGIDSKDWDRNAYAVKAKGINAYAVVHDGVWTQRGDMGWFGMASDEMDEDDWNDQVERLVRSLPKEAWLSIVDCHV
jgi:hypothetical protein